MIDISMSNAIHQSIQKLLETRMPELEAFASGKPGTHHAAKALVNFILAEHYNVTDNDENDL